jgi:oxygen-dependent protoporphyrinogen oxidase
MTSRGGGLPIVVVGGGITGLAAAHRIVERFQDSPAPPVVVLESADRAGGQVRTERDGAYIFEGGPDTLLTQKPSGVALCERLGLGADIEGFDGRRGGAEILLAGKLVRIPDGFLMMAPTRLPPLLASPLFSWRGKARMLREPFVPPRGAGIGDESLASFVVRRFGREVLDRVAEPVIAGLYTADAERLSLRVTMPRFLDLEARDGSVTRGLRRASRAASRGPFGHGTGRRGGFVTVRGGLSRIVDALVGRLPAGSLRTGAQVAALERSEAGEWTAHLAGGTRIRAAAVLLACPAFEAARAIRGHDPALAGTLDALSYAPCATVNLAYRRSQVGGDRHSFGFFVPRSENLPILACSYVSDKFEGRAPEGAVVLRAFLGGALRPHVVDEDDERLGAIAHEALRGPLGISGEPAAARVSRFPRGMPQYEVGAASWIREIAAHVARHPGLDVAGSVAGSVGLPDCIRSGEEAADRLYDVLRVYDAGAAASRVAYHANQNA